MFRKKNRYAVQNILSEHSEEPQIKNLSFFVTEGALSEKVTKIWYCLFPKIVYQVFFCVYGKNDQRKITHFIIDRLNVKN